jgi:hypothetical protein
MEEKLGLWWRKLKPGGYFGGPSCGFGFTPCGLWTLDTEGILRRFIRSRPDSSEIFTGNQGNPCWFAFKKSPGKPRVLVLSGSDRSQFESFGYLSRQNHETYSAKHGYDCDWVDWEKVWAEPRHLVWAKIQEMIRRLETSKWDQVWWIDADAVFFDHERKLDGYLHPAWNGVHPEFVGNRVMASTGVWGANLQQLDGLRDVWSRSDRGHGFFSEELCLADSIYQRPDLWKGLQLVDHRLFNAVPSKGIAYHKAADHFIVHFSGCDNLRREKIIAQINESLGARDETLPPGAATV